MGLIDRQIERQLHHRSDGTVVFEPFPGDAFLIPSKDRESELRDGLRRFSRRTMFLLVGYWTLGLGLYGLGYLVWRTTGSFEVAITLLKIRLVTAVLCIVGMVAWLWWSVHTLTAGLAPTTSEYAALRYLQRVARRGPDTYLAAGAAIGAALAVGSAVVLISFPHLEGAASAVVGGIGIVGLAAFLWCRFARRARLVAAPMAR